MAFNSSDPTTVRRCEAGICGDAPALPLYFCASCDSFYCGTCWVLQGPHRAGKVGIDGLPHEKTDVEVVKNLKAILEPPSNPEALRKLHRKDEATTWFGVVRSESMNAVTGKCLPEFKDFGRYATLMAESRPPNGAARYPQLVSFIGQTNAGKSTLVKMLISHEARKMGVPASEFPSPVVGAARDDKVPTSGDVHLYADPETLQSRFPVLYADCEGLDGGEEEPISSQSRNQPDSEAPKKSVFGGAKKRIIEWAKDDITSGRAYAVEHLYPRLLYTFSDVVVFVLRNPKTFESVALKLLLDWAAASLEKSLNQPVLPHAIVVLNATDIQVSSDEWDVDKATQNLMSKVKSAVNQVAMFRHYAEIWRRKGKEIQSMEDLIKCYYSSIKVVRIPAKGRYMLIDGQIEKLHKQILLSCDAAFYTKERARMLSHVDELNEYLQAGFKHFSKRLDEPFNFVEIAVRNNPVPQNFGDHISNLAAAMQRNDDFNDAVFIFETLSPLVASCLLLEVVRGRRPGSVEDLFDKYYRNMCNGALDRFCDMFWPCSYRDSSGRACRNMKSGHATKGHQDQNGKILGQSKTYESSFSSNAYQKIWIGLIKKNLAICEKRLEQKRHSVGASQFKILEVQDAFQLHQQEHLKAFFEGRAKHYFSMSTCYCCLMNVPQHPLPCGHVLCTDCIKNYGERLNYSSVGIASCPLHPGETKHLQRWVIRFKPDFAGVRVLSLDGGGIRGIIELEVLRAIEIYLGGRIPIQRFFDLIVGTSTGGIIALGIGAKHWSVLTSMQKFTALCYQAFTPRELHEVHGVRLIVKLRHGSKYKTTPLHRALNTAFGEQYLFGGIQDSDTAYMTKVAVTTTSGTGQTPIIITNYGRQDDVQLPYRIEFSRGSQKGLKVWHAACATSAAPSIFKPFKHPQTDRSYMDGGLYYNNPVKIANHERRLLWPDVAECHPDVMLSIGTGQNLQETEAEMESGTKSKSNAEKRKDAKSYGKLGAREAKKLKSRRQQLFNTVKNVKNFFSVLVNRIDNILDSELAWREFFAELGDPADQERNTQRYIRINPDLQSEVPSLDAKDVMKDLQAYMVNELRSPSNQIMIEDVAHRLIASSFYFEKTTPKEDIISESYICSGVILCRFESESLELREVGRYLKTKQTREFQPYFIIEDQQDASFEQKIPLSPEMIIKIIDRATFDFKALHFRISGNLASTCISICLAEAGLSEPKRYPISGFPRTLVTEDSLKEARLERQRIQARARRPGIRKSVSEAVAAPNETQNSHQHSLSDSVIPTFMQRIKPQELNRSFTFNQKYPNFLDEDVKASRTQVDKLMSFPALMPTKSNPDKDSSEVHETIPPSPSIPSSRGMGKAQKDKTEAHETLPPSPAPPSFRGKGKTHS